MPTPLPSWGKRRTHVDTFEQNSRHIFSTGRMGASLLTNTNACHPRVAVAPFPLHTHTHTPVATRVWCCGAMFPPPFTIGHAASLFLEIVSLAFSGFSPLDEPIA